jgi:hypothetical protein
MVGGLMVTAGAASGAAATQRPVVHSAGHQPSAQFLARARAALMKYLKHNHPTIMLTRPGDLPKAAPKSTIAVNSYNWSGYADAATNTLPAFSHVSGHWVMPAVVCTPEDTITSQWVGLDGLNSQTVEQDGTIGWCFEGVPTYFTWYEMYPAGAVEVGTSLLPGDQITASVTRVSLTNYSLVVIDSTHPSSSFSQTAACAVKCLNSSAEWISERPSFPIGIAPLAKYGTWSLTNAVATFRGTPGNIVNDPNNYRITMQDATLNYPLDTTSALGGGGNSFSTTWLNSY